MPDTNWLPEPSQKVNKRGAKPHVPTPEKRQMVIILVAVGLTVDEIALQLSMSKKTLHKYYSYELENGRTHIVARLGAKAIDRALKGSENMLKFCLANLGGELWNKATKLEHSGPGGVALVPPTLLVTFMEPKTLNATIDGSTAD